MLSRPKPSLFAVLLLTAAVAGQGMPGSSTAGGPIAAPPLRGLRDHVAVEVQSEGLQARAWNYDCAFRPTGVQFVPVLGSRAATTQHVGLAAAGFGREHGPWQVVAMTAPQRSGAHRVVYERAPGVAERFDGTPAGVELSWVFSERPAGQGDLVVRYEVSTTLPRVDADAGGVRFALADGVAVRLGAVTGVAADGERVAGEVRLVDRTLELRLPSAFVDSAAYPLVLDPLLGTQSSGVLGSGNDTQPDVAYDATTGTWLLVHRRAYSATSAVIVAARLDGNGVLVGVPQQISSLAAVANHPTVANVRVRRTFLVAWQQAASLLAPHEIVCATVGADTGTVSAPLVIASGSVDIVQPDATGDNGSDDEALVAYTEIGVRTRVATVTIAAPSAAPTLQTRFTVTSNPTARNPAFAKSAPSAGTYVLVWSDMNGSLPRIQARAMTRDVSLLGSEVTIASGLDLADAVADVDGNGTQFVVVHERLESGSGASFGARDVVATALVWNGTALVPGAVRVVAGRETADQKQPAIAWCRYKFLVVWADQLFAGSGNYDVRGAELAADCTDCGGTFVLNGLNGSLLRNLEHQPAIASKVAGGAADDDALITFAEADDAPPFGSTIVLQAVDALGPGGTQTVVGSGCGAAGTIGSVGGPFAIGNTDFQVRVSGLPAGGLPFLLIGFPGNERSCGTCTYVDYYSANFVLSVADSATYPIRLPCQALSLVGFTTQVQWMVLEIGGRSTPCPIAGGLSMTQRLLLPWVR